ncbi:MAG: hypothetical protein VB934_02325 [Polyangiaceae bacterium]
MAPPASTEPSASAPTTPTGLPSDLPRREVYAGFAQPCESSTIESTPRWGGLKGAACGSDGRVAGVFHGGRAGYAGTPGGWTTLHSEQPGRMQPIVATIAVREPWLWIHQVTCPECRALIGWAFIGDMTRLSDDDLVLLQQRVGVDAAPLRSVEAWQKAMVVPAADKP